MLRLRRSPKRTAQEDKAIVRPGQEGEAAERMTKATGRPGQDGEATPRPARARRPGRPKKILLSLVALGAAAAMGGLGTFAAYTSTTSASLNVTTGVVQIALAASGTGNRMSVAATGVLPGDTVSRAVDLTSTSTDALASVKLTTTAPVTSSALNTNGTNGLQLLIQRCSVTWTETANTSPQTGYTYTCSGTTTTVLGSASTPVIQTATAFTGLAATAGPGNVAPTMDHLVITATLPAATTEAQVPQGAQSIIVFTFDAAQRTAPTPR
jgi:predicted ribosomally synthesized peptide with SipW-like signal peptide